MKTMLNLHSEPWAAPRFRTAPEPLVIGLVNLMPPALQGSDSLFRRMLNAPPRRDIRLRLFLPVADGRSGWPHDYPIAEKREARSDRASLRESDNQAKSIGSTFAESRSYEPLDALWDSAGLDGLIVTGTEPRGGAMEDEPSWPILRELCDWAAANTYSTLWSCFSAHAAVLRMDGIRRRRLRTKLSGVFECRKLSDDPLFEDLPERWQIPHSRHNGLDEAELRARGYRILSGGREIGVDSFTRRHGRSQFLFLQGHPEYTPPILFNEYARDLKRYLSGASAQCPALPRHYLDAETKAHLTGIRDLGRAEAAFPAEFLHSLTRRLSHPWRGPAEQIFSGWLSAIASQKTQPWTYALARKPERHAAR